MRPDLIVVSFDVVVGEETHQVTLTAESMENLAALTAEYFTEFWSQQEASASTYHRLQDPP